MSVILLTTGVPGCGKTYVRAARFLVDDFLINSHGMHISNFPLNVDEISNEIAVNMRTGLFSFLSRKRNKVTPEDIAGRIHIIPDHVLQAWRRQESGPWEYFDGWDLKYAHIAIDEIHNFVSPSKDYEYVQKWDEFLGEVRHRGCTFEGLTQDIDSVDKVFTGRASLRLELIPAEDLRDPYFKIKMSDWYELKAAFTGHYHKTVFEFERRKQGRSWKVNHVRRFLIVPEYFRYYNSFNASLAEKETGEGGESDQDRALQYEYQRRTKVSLLFWFLRRNIFSLSWRIGLMCFAFWLCFMGGFNIVLKGWLDSMGKAAASQQSAIPRAENPQMKTPVPSPKISMSPVAFSDRETTGQGVALSAVMPGQGMSLKEFNEDLQKKELIYAGYKPSMFFDGCCWLRNGIKITEGYKFNDDGPYKDKIVLSINETERYYQLDDERCVHMF